jgi:LPPG:FO 2-phospho-L-lactate transferase
MIGKYVLLSGGVGGAKLALGLSRILDPGALTIITNTGDDFDHLGLRICPDIDTLLYTLAGLANAEQGWGRHQETWTFMAALKSLGGEDWFNLGDGDLALHIARTQALGAGRTLSAFTANTAARWGISSQIIPMSDDCVATRVLTPEGEIGFQDYFVRLQCAPKVLGLRFAGAETAAIAPKALAALSDPDLTAVIVAPSNPYLSIDPILAVPGIVNAIRGSCVPIIAVSPIISGLAIKGPTAKIMLERGHSPSPLVIADHYAGLIDALLIDTNDAGLTSELKIPALSADILMKTLDDRERVARAALSLAKSLPKKARLPA